MDSLKVTRKYQITIPRDVRERLKIKEGDRVRIHDEGKKIIVEIIKDRSNDSIIDMLSLIDTPIRVDAVKLVEDSLHDD